jgi:hypothetical protein
MNDKDYSHEGFGFTFKKWQADNEAVGGGFG